MSVGCALTGNATASGKRALSHSFPEEKRRSHPTKIILRPAEYSIAHEIVGSTAMKNLVGMWYSSNELLWWLSFATPDEERPWWKFWRRAKEGHFLGVVIVQAPDMEEAVQVAWRKKINPGGEVRGIPILNAD